jgi:hypothetical protein
MASLILQGQWVLTGERAVLRGERHGHREHIAARAGIATINQTERCWLDLSAFQDVVIWTDVKAVTVGGGQVFLYAQTSPTRDEVAFSNFVQITSPSGGPITSPSVYVNPGLLASSSTPLARWLRWQLTTSSTSSVWDITFRIFVAANAPGRRRRAGTYRRR